MDLQESKQFDGQVLVAREAERNQTGGASHVVDTYEPVAGTHTVMKQCPAAALTIRASV